MDSELASGIGERRERGNLHDGKDFCILRDHLRESPFQPMFLNQDDAESGGRSYHFNFRETTSCNR